MPDLGETLGRYTLLKRLAAGGMGEIFLAARMGPLGFAPPIALKVLREELASDHQFIDMLVDEAKISMFLNHQNVVSVLDFGEDRGRYYIAMELVQGVTLKGILDGLRARNRRLDVATAVYITNELCRALKYAHTRTNHAGEPLNIVHRDVTPANVLISVQGEVKLTDFGIARAKNRVHQTQAGVLKGKFGYMAPEMLRYETIDARADIFCAGVMLYEMVAGQHPVEGASIMDAITRLEEKDVRPPSHHNPKLPRDLDQIVMKALEPRPDERWSSAAELAAALQELVLSDAARRGELRHGSESVSGLVRELFPHAFDPPLPRELADQMFAQARKRASLPPEARGTDALGTDPDRVPTGEDLVASDPLPGRDFQREPSAVAVRPAIQLPEVRSKSEVASLPTREAVTGLKEASTLIPPSARGEVELDTDEHAKNLLASAVAAASQRAATISLGSHDPAEVARPTFSDNATMAFSAVRGDDEDAATGEIVIRFPETSSPTHLPGDRREQLISEPRRPELKADPTMPYTAPTREAIERAHENERTVAQPDAFDAGRVDDGKTVTGMALPDWDALVPGRAPEVQVFDPPTSLEEPVRDFAEQELPQRGRAPSYEGGAAYDDGATAFGGPRSYNDDQTAFGMNSVSPEEPATIIPDADLIGGARGAALPPSQQFSDDTLLDGISKDSVEKAKAELGLHKRPQLRAPDEEPADTRLRQDALIDEAMAELSVQPKRLTGPLRVKAPDAPAAASVMPPSVSPSLGVPVTAPSAASDPFKSRTPMPPRVGGRDAPRTGGGVEVAPASKIVPLNNNGGAPVVGPVEIGSATGRWMRGELAANDLSWGDDAAARRAVATRNAAPSHGGPAAPPRPGMGTQPGVMVPGGGPGLVHGMGTPALTPGMGHSVGPGQPTPGMTNVNAPPPYPLPHTPQRRASRSLTLGLAMATAAVALAAVATVLFRTKVAWPEVTFETEPPGATVRIDERVMGERTPARFAVRPNVEHRVELQLEGYVPRQLAPGVELSFFGSRTYQVALERLTPKIRVSPVAGRVFVNDTLVGTGAEVELAGIAAGTEVKLRVEADGFIAWSQTFAKLSDVPASLDVPLSPELAPAPAPSEPPKRQR